MYIRKLHIAAIASVALLGGCATSTHKYTPPEPVSIQNSKTTSNTFDATWDTLVKKLSSDFFVINNIDKASRLINISFSSSNPTEFVDCGRSARTFKSANGEQNYDYPSAGSAEYLAANNKGVAFNFRRTAKLEGRTNIYIAPDANGTLITVNTKYVVNVQVRVFHQNGGIAANESQSWDFSTKQPSSDGQVQCHATGSIERRILQLVE